jgi:transposase
MAKTFRPFDRDQMLLMPPSLHDWVSEDHLARFIADLVESLDLRAIEAVYTEERGRPAWCSSAGWRLTAPRSGPTPPSTRR